MIDCFIVGCQDKKKIRFLIHRAGTECLGPKVEMHQPKGGTDSKNDFMTRMILERNYGLREDFSFEWLIPNSLIFLHKVVRLTFNWFAAS